MLRCKNFRDPNRLCFLDFSIASIKLSLPGGFQELGRLQGTSGARSACLLAHAYGSALLLHRPIGEAHAVYDEVGVTPWLQDR